MRKILLTLGLLFSITAHADNTSDLMGLGMPAALAGKIGSAIGDSSMSTTATTYAITPSTSAKSLLTGFPTGATGAGIVFNGEGTVGGSEMVFDLGTGDFYTFRQAATNFLEMDSTKMVFSPVSYKIIPGSVSLLFRNNADSATNLGIADAGALTARGSFTTSAGDVIFSGSGNTLSVQEATAATACMGVATPNGTTPVAITTSCAASGSRVFYTRAGAITNMGTISTTTAPSGTGFSFASTGASDTLASSVIYLIVKESA